MRQFLQVFQLVHQFQIDVQTAGGIQNHHIMAVILGEPHCLPHNDAGVDLTHLKDFDAGTLAHHLQLVDCRRTVDIACHQQRIMPLFFQHLRQLGGVGGLTGALQAHEHDDIGNAVDDARRLGREIDACVLIAHEAAQLFVDDLDDLLRRCQAVEHLFAHGTLGDLLHKVLDDLIADICLQQRHAHFPHRCLDIAFRQLAVGFQLFEHLIQFSGKSFKCHVVSSSPVFPAGALQQLFSLLHRFQCPAAFLLHGACPPFSGGSVRPA